MSTIIERAGEIPPRAATIAEESGSPKLRNQQQLVGVGAVVEGTSTQLQKIPLRTQLLEKVNELEAVTKQILSQVIGSGPSTSSDLTPTVLKQSGQDADNSRNSSNLARLAELFATTEFRLRALLTETVPQHQSRQRRIEEMERGVTERDQLAAKLMSELKELEDRLAEATYQAERKLKSVRQSETNRVFSEEVIRFSHQISKAHSVASPPNWCQGDPQRPFPTVADFATSQLMRTHLGQQFPPTSTAAGYTFGGTMPPGGSRFPATGPSPQMLAAARAMGAAGGMRGSPGANSIMMASSSSFMASPSGNPTAATAASFAGSPMMGRSPFTPRAGQMGMESPLARGPGSGGGGIVGGVGGSAGVSRANPPSILQRRSSQQQQQQGSAATTPTMQLQQQQQQLQAGGSSSPAMAAMQQAMTAGGGRRGQSSNGTHILGGSGGVPVDLEPVGQMSSDSSSSSSSGDEDT